MSDAAAPVAAPAAAPSAGTPTSPHIQASLKAFLSPPREPEDRNDAIDSPVPPTQSKAASPSQEGKAAPADKTVPEGEAQAETQDPPDAADDAQSDDAQSEQWQPSDLSELLTAAFGESQEKGFDLPVKVKVDGKEGTATIRDLVKSYQLDSHHHQKAESLNTDRKAFEARRSEFETERADKLLKFDAGLKTLERALYGEFASVDWNKLAAEDPNSYHAKRSALQDRLALIQDIGQQVGQEQQNFQAAQQEKARAFLEEQKKLLLANVPEWTDDTRRAKDKAEIVGYLKDYGITQGEFEKIGDHRYALVIRDALRWHQLQKSKPALMHKVKTAPKLLKPGFPQSRTAKDSVASNKLRDVLKQSGRVRDAAPLLRNFV